MDIRKSVITITSSKIKYSYETPADACRKYLEYIQSINGKENLPILFAVAVYASKSETTSCIFLRDSNMRLASLRKNTEINNSMGSMDVNQKRIARYGIAEYLGCIRKAIFVNFFNNKPITTPQNIISTVWLNLWFLLHRTIEL
jgi:hypothetical protein